jgi:hypothetical protein
MKKILIIHPFLFALFPILALYAYSSRAVPTTVYDMALPVGLSLAGSVGLFVLLRTMLKNDEKAGLLTTLVLMSFFSYGHLASRLKQGFFVLGQYSLFVAVLIFVSVVFWVVIRSKRSTAGLTRLLNTMSVVLIVFNLVTASRVYLQSTRVNAPPAIEAGLVPAHRPNVYFILLDAYARADVLSEVYDYDNSDFVGYLEQKGFYVAAQSPAAYCQTELSLSASLNLTYLDDVARSMGKGSTNIRPLMQMIKNSKLRQLLKSRGYSFVTISSGLPITDIRNADVYIGFKGLIKDFRKNLLDTTPLPLFLNILSDKSQYVLHRNRVLGAFRALASLGPDKSPFFVFTHILSPHTPYVFGRDGEAINPPGRFFINDGLVSSESERRAYIKGYVDQLHFINKVVKETIDTILANSKEPPMIILQSDHGPRAYYSWKSADASYLKESMAVLNAVYFPDGHYDDLYPGLSPVNATIALVNRLTGSNIAFLDDRSYYSPGNRPYDFQPFDPSLYTKELSDFAFK